MIHLLVIGDAAVNDGGLACVDNNERQADHRAGIRRAVVTLRSTIPLHQILECNLLHGQQHASNGTKWTVSLHRHSSWFLLSCQNQIQGLSKTIQRIYTEN